MKQKAAELYASGLSMSQVSEKLGVPISLVRAALIEFNVPARPRHNEMGKKRGPAKGQGYKPLMSRRSFDFEEAARLYLDGKSINQIANILGAGGEGVRRALKVQGIARRRRGGGDGEKNHQFKGGTRTRKDGYVIRLGSREKELEHRVIAEKALGRPLEDGMVVHHINCDPSDNRPENLLICSQEYHMQLHSRMRKHPYWKQFGKSAN